LAKLVEGPKERPFQAPFVAGELGKGAPFFGVAVERASDQYLITVSLVFSLLERLRRFRMPGFIRDADATPQPV
jgi:hypothetical protein